METLKAYRQCKQGYAREYCDTQAAGTHQECSVDSRRNRWQRSGSRDRNSRRANAYLDAGVKHWYRHVPRCYSLV